VTAEAPDLLGLLPADARLVLHVGCGTGRLGAAYKRRNPRTRFVGIEPDAAAAEAARRVLDHVWHADIDCDPTPFAGDISPRSIDCLVYAEALAGDPWKTLDRHAGFLAEDATLVLCLPNPDHWRATEARMKGFSGFSDMRFADEAVRAALSRAGLTAIDVTPLGADPSGCEAFVDRVAPALRGLGHDVAAYRARALPRHHVWRARRTPPARRLTIVSTMLHPVGGVSDVRVTEPMRALMSEPSLAPRVISRTQEAPEGVDGPKIFVFHRPLLAGAQGQSRISRLLDAGWLLVCEFDDHPDYIRVLQRPDVLNFRGVHAVQTSTPALAEVLGRLNPEIGVFPNAIADVPEVRNFAADDRITLFFAGLNREQDWPPFLDAINAVATRFGERLHFEVINDRRLFEALATRRKNFTPLCDYKVYGDILARCEISFMPLADTAFNRCKSDLKFIEAGARGVLALASSVAYEDTIADGRTGILFRDARELEQRLTRLVNEPALARVIGDAARRYVIDNRMLSYQVAERSAWYHALWERRDDLNRSLLARVPELGEQ